MAEVQITSLTKANKNSDSLRTTVPSSVIRMLKLKEGDKLSWAIEALKKDVFIVKLEAVKTSKESTGRDGGGVEESE